MSRGALDGLTLIEGSAFVAAPLGGMTLAQLGADVVRFDDIRGGLDHERWPLAPGGQSLFWAGLNKGKRSITVDLHGESGRELVSALIAAAGNFLTNFPARGWLAYEALRARREDLVMVALTGNRDGTSEVDYTVNPATGFPWATGPRNLAEPLNSVLPAWDAQMGGLAATGLLAADRHRSRTGEGQLIRLALSDVAFAIGSGRYEARDFLAAALRPWFAERDLGQVRDAFAGTGVSWGSYQTFSQLVREDPRCTTDNPMWEEREHPGVGTYLMPGTPLEFSAIPRQPVRRAPLLGEHTDEVLAGLLGLTDTEIDRLARDGVVGVRAPEAARSTAPAAPTARSRPGP